MGYSQASYRLRRSFGKIRSIIPIPNLIGMQIRSYERFLQKGSDLSAREDIGLQGVFNSVFPIKDYNKNASLEFVNYSFSEVKYDKDECLQRGMTYEAPIKITVRLVVYDVDKETGTRSIRDIKEQEIYFGTIPLMTENGTFIINGTERVVVSQLHRSPGLFFDHDKGKTHASKKTLYSSRIIPLRGSWLDFEFDHKDILHVRIDRRRKMPVTVYLKALGYDENELLNYFYPKEKISIGKKEFKRELNLEILLGSIATEDIRDPKTKKLVIRKNIRVNQQDLEKLEDSGIKQMAVAREDLLGRVLAEEVVDPATGEVLAQINEEVTEDLLETFQTSDIKEISLIIIDKVNYSASFRNTLALDRVKSDDDAKVEIYRKLRPSNPPTMEVARDFFNKLFFNPEYYDLSQVGRLKLNLQLDLEPYSGDRVLTKEDIMLSVKKLFRLKDAQGPVDDIDNLGNRRVRAVGELLENQFRIGLVRMERTIKERMALQDVETLMPHDLINPKPVTAVVREFFGSSQLSQFMDQTNPLSEVTHKRRLSALGPGGLTRERAGFEVRDVHSTHYGRICPIETPEGPNIGLIVSLSTYARVNDYGFVETPYRKVKKNRATEDVEYLSAMDEKNFAIAQANAPLDKKGNFVLDRVNARRAGEYVVVPPEEVAFMDVSPNQIVSAAAALIPFLENDDANRALMGSNMQRQAVPLLTSRAPVVGTGMERVVAHDSGVTVVATRDGVVEEVDATRIVVRASDGGVSEGYAPPVDIFRLTKFKRSNQNTCFNQKPIVKKGDMVKRGEIIADGPATEMGELALGRNIMVAFMSWGGYNFEDSILVSERIAKEDVFTSIHIEEFEVMARDTKLGKEDITRDIPNLGEEALKNLDGAGIVRIGAKVKASDILVGKITPKGETQLSPEEKLLRAIFGEKALDVKDTSLRVPPGVEGVVIDAKVFSRRGIDKDSRAIAIESDETLRIQKDLRDELAIIKRSYLDRLKGLLEGKPTAAPVKDPVGRKSILKTGEEFSAQVLDKLPTAGWASLRVKDDPGTNENVDRLYVRYRAQIDEVKGRFEPKFEKFKRGDDLPPGVIKMVKVYVAVKRKLSVGDKMAGRHGNKGVVSRVLPEADMPYFADGTPVDIVLNPLGVPSRMNAGQILETHLGWAAKGLGDQLNTLIEAAQDEKKIEKKLKKVWSPSEMNAFKALDEPEKWEQLSRQIRDGLHLASPVFDGADEDEIRAFLKEAGLPSLGGTILYDGRDGEPFDREITVGIMYMMKLHHLVDDKLHARSIGPYSLVTQQPLGGKAQFGGQRLGEMEVWALEAYGASYCLQEFLTVKSDDVVGRTRMYEKIVKGENTLEAGLPESFNVLVKELQALCLDVKLLEHEED